MEQTFSTDQDNAIIYENTSPERSGYVNDYFLKLGGGINQMLAAAGFRLCKGLNMAGNQKWCQPLDTWKKYFSDWIKAPGPEELLSISIFFDFRFCHGDPSLVSSLREFILSGLSANDIFFHHMASAWIEFSKPYKSIPAGTGDIKKFLMPLTGICRLYALKHSVSSFSTIERLVELSSAGMIDRTMMIDCVRAWKSLTGVRLAHQAGCIARGIEPDNEVNFGILDHAALYNISDALRSTGELILKASQEHYIRNI
jgi:CBS domain-containing protein